jgi:hypothetical protein
VAPYYVQSLDDNGWSVIAEVYDYTFGVEPGYYRIKDATGKFSDAVYIEGGYVPNFEYVDISGREVHDPVMGLYFRVVRVDGEILSVERVIIEH